MISDVLSDAIDDIQDYLGDLPEVYAFCRERIDQLVIDMESMRAELDSKPIAYKEYHIERVNTPDSNWGARYRGGGDMVFAQTLPELRAKINDDLGVRRNSLPLWQKLGWTKIFGGCYKDPTGTYAAVKTRSHMVTPYWELRRDGKAIDRKPTLTALLLAMEVKP